MTDRRRRLWLGLGALAVAGGVRWWRGQAVDAPSGVAAVLRDNERNAGFARVEGPRAFEFPRDHAAHPAFRHEWWYVTGHLRGDEAREFGFQMTFFRYALTPRAIESPSRWRARDLVLAHFAVTDVAGQRFHHATRRARAALGLAGADEAKPCLWLKDWQLALTDADAGRWRFTAATAHAALTLTLIPTKPLVLQGDAGYSRKSDAPGNASHYYSLPRLAASGELTLNHATQAVTGTAWFDREWGTSALGDGQSGWDWFALQFDDGRELTFYRLRRLDGSPDPHSRGLLIAADGSAQPLAASDVVMTPVRWWRSPRTRIRYPVAWRVEVPRAQLNLTLQSRLDAQEWTGDLRYWEGQVEVRDGNTRLGLGYLEMTGYE